MNTLGIRHAFETLNREASVVWRFGLDDSFKLRLHDAVKDLPIYADRRPDVSLQLKECLDSFPFMTRSDLRQHFPHGFLRPSETFAALVASKKVEVVRTSGTSSDRLQILWETDWWERQELAALCTHPDIQPYLNDSYREAVLTTPLCSESVCKTGPATMEERRIDNLLFLNTQHDPSRWNSTDLARMLDEIEQFKPVAIEADPVYMASLTRYIRDRGRPIPALQWIILTYEFVSDIDKALIQSCFGCPVYEFYGLTEAGVFFLECSRGRHHFCGNDAIVEVVRPNLPEDGDSFLHEKMGEVLVTTWGNRAAPLLRYRTGDLVTLDERDCPCGKPGPTVRTFEGRIRDLLELPDHRLFTPRQIDSSLSGIQGLAQYRCIQQQPNVVYIEYIRDSGSDPGPEIQARFQSLWAGMTVQSAPKPFIAPEPSGKYRTVVPL